jgi:hypothetical protein
MATQGSSPNYQEENPLYGSEGAAIQEDQAQNGSTNNSPIQDMPGEHPNEGSETTAAYGPYGVDGSQWQPHMHGASTPESPGEYMLSENTTQHGASGSPESVNVENELGPKGRILGNNITSPGSAGGESAIHELNAHQLGEYLVDRGLTGEAVTTVMAQGFNGESWMHAVASTAEEGAQALTELWQEIGVKSRLTRSRLTSEAILGFSKWKFLQERVQRLLEEDQTETQKKGRDGSEEAGRAEASPDGGQRKAYAPAAKVHYAPKIPSYDPTSSDSAAGIDALQVYGKTLATWVEPFSTRLSDGIKHLMTRIDETELHFEYESLSKEDLQLDTELGGHLFATAPKAAQDELFEDEKRELQGHTSTLKILWSWMGLVDSNSKTRMTSSLSKWLTRKPTQKPQELYADL